MRIFFTSDLHLGHANIAAYARRPFIKEGDLLEKQVYGKPKWASYETSQVVATRMNKALVQNWNNRVKPEDTVYHIGDFCCKGNERGVKGSRTKAEKWEQALNGKIIHIRGNHDANNSVKIALESAVIKFAHHTWFMVHRPLGTIEDVPSGCDVVLCGHVHSRWKTKFIGSIPMINIGVDVNKFAPVTKAEVETLRCRAVKTKRS